MVCMPAEFDHNCPKGSAEIVIADIQTSSQLCSSIESLASLENNTSLWTESVLDVRLLAKAGTTMLRSCCTGDVKPSSSCC